MNSRNFPVHRFENQKHPQHHQDGMMDAVLRVIQGDQREISQLVINETLKEPVGSLGSDQSWSTWLELPVVCILDHIGFRGLRLRLEPKMPMNQRGYSYLKDQRVYVAM